MQLDLFSQHGIGKGKCMQSRFIKLIMEEKNIYIIQMVRLKHFLQGLAVFNTHSYYQTHNNHLMYCTIFYLTIHYMLINSPYDILQ